MAVCALNRVVNRVNAAVNASGNALLQPSFLLAFPDAGAGVVSTTAARGGAAATFTRATVAWTKLASGLWAEVASGQPRSMYLGMNTISGATTGYGGYLAEGARTQLITDADIRDMSGAAWVKVNTTAALTSVGIGGAATSASRVTCTSNGGTILFTLTAAASSRTYSLWVRRVTGVGTVTISQVTGASLDITALINSTTYTQVSVTDSILNAAFGITFATSGDAIDVDFNQFEAGAFASTPIATAATRNADVLTYAFTPGVVGTMFSQFSATVTSPTKVLFSGNDATQNECVYMGLSAATPFMFVADGGVTQVNSTIGGALADGLSSKLAVAYALNDVAGAVNGGSLTTDATATMPTMTRLEVGGVAGVGQTFGSVRRVAYWPQRLPDSVLVSLTA